MTDMDYSKTRIFERHTNLETTNKKNAELKELLEAVVPALETHLGHAEMVQGKITKG